MKNESKIKTLQIKQKLTELFAHWLSLREILKEVLQAEKKEPLTVIWVQMKNAKNSSKGNYVGSNKRQRTYQFVFILSFTD